jgi:hypothetical protein
MSGKSLVSASEEQSGALLALDGYVNCGEADRARAILLTLLGWTSPRIAEGLIAPPRRDRTIGPSATSVDRHRPSSAAQVGMERDPAPASWQCDRSSPARRPSHAHPVPSAGRAWRFLRPQLGPYREQVHDAIGRGRSRMPPLVP